MAKRKAPNDANVMAQNKKARTIIKFLKLMRLG